MGPVTNEKDKKMYFVAKKLDIPTFILSKNATETATTKKKKHICGYYGSLRTKFCPTPRILENSRDLITPHSWQLPPNRYDVLMEPFKRFKGLSGAYWAKEHTHKRLPPTHGIKQQWKFYEIAGDTERRQKLCNEHKGVFVKNARQRRASIRCMVNNSSTCYRDPNHPGPAAYYPQTHFIKVAKKRKDKFPNPHVFLRNSCVPLKANSVHKKNISFAPGPGRYETRFPKICTCFVKRKRKLIYLPGLQLLIDRQKRLKFRRQRYDKIQAHKYCTPDWNHVKGRGYRFLFKNIPPKPYEKPQLKIAKSTDAKTTHRSLKLHPDARYFNIINDPERQILSTRIEPLREIPKKVTFNCMAKRIVRRTLRYNPNVAFNSGKERFADLERAPALTASELEAKKNLLPIERQLRNYPITTRRLTEISAKLHETPRHMQPVAALRLRKRLFKFLPLPTAKILVTEEDLRLKRDSNYVAKSYLHKELNVMDFMSKSVDDKDLEEIQMYRKMHKI